MPFVIFNAINVLFSLHHIGKDVKSEIGELKGGGGNVIITHSQHKTHHSCGIKTKRNTADRAKSTKVYIYECLLYVDVYFFKIHVRLCVCVNTSAGE